MFGLFCFMLNFVFDVGHQNSGFCGFQFGLGFNLFFCILIHFWGLGFEFIAVEFEFVVFMNALRFYCRFTRGFVATSMME